LTKKAGLNIGTITAADKITAAKTNTKGLLTGAVHTRTNSMNAQARITSHANIATTILSPLRMNTSLKKRAGTRPPAERPNGVDVVDRGYQHHNKKLFAR